jgi:fatty acid desaturase
MDATTEAEPHEPHWISRAAFPILSGSLLLTFGLLTLALHAGNYWLMVPLTLIASHLMHGQLIAFHEASHGLLRKHRWLNEVDGFLIGAFSLLSFSLYRAVHQTHHMHLGTPRDEELWPFVFPSAPRWARVLAAVVELFLGYFFTPFLFLRAFLRAGSPVRSPRMRRRIWVEMGLIALFWAVLLGMVAHFGIGRDFLWVYCVPALIAGNLQSWRKYIEHVGLTGATVRSGTRSIVADSFLGRLTSFTLLHEPYHGVHHLRAGLGHAELPRLKAILQPEREDELAPFPSYGSALLNLFRSLPDPRVGSQWNRMSERPEPVEIRTARVCQE